MSESLTEVRGLIKDMYELAGVVAETAQDFMEDCDLVRPYHAMFEYKGLQQLSKGMIGQDSGQPWFLFWILNGIEVCNQGEVQVTPDIKARCVKYLRQCHNEKEGGFSGAPGLQTHLASTYAAMMAIVNIGTKEAYDIVDIPKMKQFLLSIKNNLDVGFDKSHPNNNWILKQKGTDKDFKYAQTHEYVATLPGSVAIHLNGEMDMRGSYCALVTMDILNLIENNEEMTRGMGDFIVSCQTYEGGIACSPYGEAHGGYTFCGLASLILLQE